MAGRAKGWLSALCELPLQDSCSPTATHLIPSSVNGVGPQMQWKTLEFSTLLCKNSERRTRDTWPCLPFHSGEGAERTNSTSNLGKEKSFQGLSFQTHYCHISRSVRPLSQRTAYEDWTGSESTFNKDTHMSANSLRTGCAVGKGNGRISLAMKRAVI